MPRDLRSGRVRGIFGSLLLLMTALVVPAELVAQAPVTAAPPATAADPTKAGPFDNGKMWTFEYPPLDYLRTTYNFAPDTTWFRRARLGALRIPGCSASLVSPRGLVLTNHHCGREATVSVTKTGENFLDNGFYARTQAEERKAEEMYADQLIAIEDVTQEIDAAAAGKQGAAAAQAREAAEQTISERISTKHGGKEKSIEVEIVSLYAGARTSAYVFRRYTDVRVVMAPELQIGYFGGDSDNFTYPRYDLDFTFLRLYGPDGQPLQTPEAFRWSDKGITEGDLVFVIGNPGSTTRLQTVAQLEFRRDVQDKTVLGLLTSRSGAIKEYIDAHKDAPEKLRNELFSLLNSQKAYSGIVAGLNDETIIARRRDSENKFVEAVKAKPELAPKYGTLVSDMTTLMTQKRQFSKDFMAFAGLGNPSLDAPVFLRALFAVRYVGAKAQGAPEADLAEMKNTILEIPNIPADLQEDLLAARLRDIQSALGANSPEVQAILEGRSPEGAATIIVQQSALADSAKAAKALSDGSLTSNDPALKLANAVLARYRPYMGGVGPIQQKEQDLMREIGRARFELHGTKEPPDATFSLRLADGLVKRYPYNGTMAPAYTTFYGMFDRFYSHGGGEWALPKRWTDKAATLKMATAVNFISTADIIGGNSGSPVVDKDLRVVGLVFDGNIESLSGDYIYLDTKARAVAVDVRGIMEALRTVYGADRIVQELLGAPAPARR